MNVIFGLGLAVLLVLIIVLLLDIARRRVAAGLPRGRVLQQDTLPEDAATRGATLYSAEYGLKGRPDYLVQVGKYVIPVEVKTTRNIRRPRSGHIAQLFAYCLLVEEEYGIAPPYGILTYPDQTFHLPYGEPEREWVLDTLAAIREDAASNDVLPNHNQPARCQACQFYGVCGREVTAHER